MSSGKMMRMAGYSSTKMEYEEVNIPEVPEEGYLVKVAFTGVCHSDIMLQRKMDTVLKPLADHGLVLGHEISGYVHKIGGKVTDSDLNIGDPVLLYAWGGCLNCDACKNYVCPNKMKPGSHEYGVWLSGGYQEYVVVPKRMLIKKLPSGLPLDQACQLACSGLTSYNAVTRIKETLQTSLTHFKKGSLLIIGAGGLGLWAVRWAKLLLPTEVKIVVADMDMSKLEQAKKDGADDVVCWDKEESFEQHVVKTKEVCNGGINGCIDFVNVAATLQKFAACADHGATCLLVGLMGETFPPIPTEAIPLKGWTFQGVYVGTLPQQSEVIQLAKEKQIPSPPIQYFELSQLREVLSDLKNGKISGRAVIKYDCSEYTKTQK